MKPKIMEMCIVGFSLVILISQAFAQEQTQIFPPPLKQIMSGVALMDIKCNDGKYVIYKYNRMRAACVTSETENKLIFERGWATMHLGLPANDNMPRDLCNFYQGKWLPEHKECLQLEESLQCSLLGGSYDECASACRHDPNYPDVVCTDNCVEICRIELSTLEDIKNHPAVKAFYAKYEDAYESVRSDHISYFAGSEDDAHVRMNLFFDENYELDYIDFHCYFQNVHQFEIPQEDIVSKLEKYDCKKSRT